MARVRVIVVAVAVVAGWVLNATSITKGWTLPLVAATVAFAMLVWAEWDRHDLRSKTTELESRIAVITDRSTENRPRWYPEHTVIWADDEEGRNLVLTLHPLRTNRIAGDGIRCTVEDPDGLVTVTTEWTPKTVEAGQRQVFVNYPSRFDGANAVREGTYRVLWEDNGPDAQRPELCRYVFEVPSQ